MMEQAMKAAWQELHPPTRKPRKRQEYTYQRRTEPVFCVDCAVSIPLPRRGPSALRCPRCQGRHKRRIFGVSTNAEGVLADEKNGAMPCLPAPGLTTQHALANSDQTTTTTVAGQTRCSQVPQIMSAAVVERHDVVDSRGKASAVWTAHLATPGGRLENCPPLSAVTAVVVCLAHDTSEHLPR
jgi:hypothetical protein